MMSYMEINSYTESKKELDKIRSDFACAGDVIFRTASQCVVECGQETFRDNEWVVKQMAEIDGKHDEADRQGKILWISRDFEKGIIECGEALAKVNTYDLISYMQREMWFSGDVISYQRAIELLKKCLYDIEQREGCEDKLFYQSLDDIGFYDSEIKELGFGYLLKNDEEE